MLEIQLLEEEKVLLTFNTEYDTGCVSKKLVPSVLLPMLDTSD